MEWFFFIAAAAVTLVAAFMVVLSRNQVVSALWLVVAFCGTAGLFLVQRAQFVAVVQIVVYAGAIIVFFLFVLMLLNLRPEERVPDEHRVQKGLAFYLAAVFVLVLSFGLYLHFERGLPSAGPEVAYEIGKVEPLGMRLFTTYLFPFEVVSFMLLAAMVGAVAIARRERKRS